MADDSTVSIRITGAVDASLTASAASAQSAIENIGSSAGRTISPLQDLGLSLEGIGKGLNGLSDGFRTLGGAARGGGDGLKGMSSAAQGLQPALGALGRAVSSAAISGIADGAVQAAGALVQLGTQIFANTAALNGQAAQAHMSVEDFQVYTLALRESGMSADDAAAALDHFAARLGEAQSESGAARDALNELGINAQDLARGNALPRIAAGLLAVRDATTRARLEQELFARSGPEIEDALSAIAGGASTLKEKYEGLYVTRDVADKAQDASVKIDLAMQRLETSAAPSVTALADRLRNLLDEINHFNDEGFFDKLVDIGKAVENVRTMGLSGELDARTNDAAAKQAQNAQAQNFPFALSDARPKPSAGSQGGLENVAVTGELGAGGTGFGGSSTNQDKFENELSMKNNLAGLSSEAAAKEQAVIQDANAALEDGNKILRDQYGNVVKTVSSYEQAVQVIGRQHAAQIEALAGTKQMDQQAAELAKSGEQKRVAAVRASGEQIIQADQGTADERKQIVAALWDSFIAGENLTSQQMIAADTERTAQLTQIDKQAAANKRAIDQENVNTSVELARIELGEKKAMLEQDVAAGRITIAQKIELQKHYATIAAAIEIQVLQNAIDAGNLTVVAANANANKIVIIREQLKATLQQIDTGIADTSAQIWQGANQEILSSEGTLVSDMVTKRQSLARDLEQVGWQLLEKELSQDAEYWTEAALLAVEGTAKIKATQQGGLLQNAAMGLFGGGSGGAGGAANSLTQTPQLSALTANTTALSSLTAALTSHGVLVTTNSGALSLGAAATTTNATTTGAHAAILGANVASTSANVAATTVNASVTGVSAAATTAHATVMGANTIATIANTIATWVESAADLMPFASGADNIPYDMPAFIHKGEMIVPADVASQVRAGNINIGSLADIAANHELTPVDMAGPAAFGGSSSLAAPGGNSAGNFAGSGDTYNNMGGLHIHGMDLATIAHNPAFQREATRVMRNMHRNAVRR